MLKEGKTTGHIDKKEFVKALLMFRSIPEEKQMLALAFVNGMEFQKSISETEKPPVKGMEGTTI